jgi:hypothetical protein
MNSFSLEYTDDAEDMLAEAWLAAKNRRAATVAQTQIDQRLSRDPKNVGEELSEELWRILVPPLVAYYEIDEQKSKVTVTGFGLLI